MIQKLDNHLTYKIHYIAINSSNFADEYDHKTFSIIEYENDLKYTALNKKLVSVRDKYGVMMLLGIGVRLLCNLVR